jgi:hypothetical protein
MLGAKVKNRPSSAYWIYRPRGMLSGAHAPHALTAGEMPPPPPTDERGPPRPRRPHVCTRAIITAQ